ncbi:Muscarinic acetylcholine receptor gar-3 [Aphelenchoides bicaudatus]|nr:Muscarinic acetylcholine receptor gar-3 [Aphelenchoides bicaudatus]
MNVQALGQDATSSNTDLPSVADAAARFASQLFEQQSFTQQETEKPQQDSKVLDLVMQVFQNMLNTTPSSFDTASTVALNRSSNDPDFYSTSIAEASEAGITGVVPVIIIGVIFAIATTLGNALVMISIRLDRQLQTISNYFLFSLAVADITIGIVSIPLMTYYSANGRWGIGWGLCQVWLSIDYLMSNASVLSLLLISFDRYFSITRPLTYRPRRTTRKALFAISFAYIISLVLWPPWIIGWPYIEGIPATDDGSCVVQFLAVGGNRWPSQIATIATSVAAFYLPVSIMIYLYWRVYRETRKRTEQFRHLQAGQIRGIGARNAFPNDSDSYKDRKSLDKRSKQFFPFVDGVAAVGKSRQKEKMSWLRYCVGKAGTEVDSEESSEIIPANDADWMSKVDDATSDGVPPISPTANSTGNRCFRNRNANNSETAPMLAQQQPILHTYTVLIEYKDGESKRPSVRLSSCDSDCYTTTPPDSNRSSGKRLINNSGPIIENGKRRTSLPHDNSVNNLSAVTSPRPSQQPLAAQQNGKQTAAAQRDEIQRKSEKERRKNERRQETKAAKTLSAILFAFIVTWTPYNIIVCWEAFFPRSIPEIFFTISYCLCYVNSTINPIAYATNGRFLKTYKRILCCRWRHDRRNESLYRHAYLRRA